MHILHTSYAWQAHMKRENYAYHLLGKQQIGIWATAKLREI